MGIESRRNARYPEIGRVFCEELCALPGILDNISADGCKIHFPVAVVLDLEKEYMLKIKLTRSADVQPLQLMCKPMWVNEASGTTQIGMKILFSPDDARLHEFISFLQDINDDSLPDIL